MKRGTEDKLKILPNLFQHQRNSVCWDRLHVQGAVEQHPATTCLKVKDI